MLSKLVVLWSVLATTTAFGQVNCPEVLTQNGVLISPTEAEMPAPYFLGLDGNDLGHQVVETKQFQVYRDIDDLTVNCLQTGNAAPSSRVVYESSIIVIYTMYPDFVDYVILVPRTGSDDIVHYRGTRRDFNLRTDALIFQKQSMFKDLKQIIASKISS